MNKFLYWFSFIVVAVLHLRAMELGSLSAAQNETIRLAGAELSNSLGSNVEHHINSFVEMVSGKVVNKLEDHIHKDNVADKMLMLLENNAELFDTHQYKGQNLALIQTRFFKKLKEKFLNSKFGNKIRSLGIAAKKKLTHLYHIHKDKIKHFFQLMLKGIIVPIFVKFTRKNLAKWKKNIVEAIKKTKGDVKKVALPIVDRLYVNVAEKLDDLAHKHSINIPEGKVLQEIAKDEKDIEKLEKDEAAIVNA